LTLCFYGDFSMRFIQKVSWRNRNSSFSLWNFWSTSISSWALDHVRDLKPENRLLDQDQYIKIYHFGLAWTLEKSIQKSVTLAGPVFYCFRTLFRKRCWFFQWYLDSWHNSFSVLHWPLSTQWFYSKWTCS
jgi:hypothetical protein